MPRRVAAISLPEIRIELAREREENPSGGASDFLAVIVARAGSAVQVERDVLGNTRIDFVSSKACALGVHPRQTVAAARAKCAALRVRVVAEGAVRTALARIAEAALAFGPATSFDIAQDVVWIDVSGCAHLHGGEIELARAIRKRVSEMGYACRVAIASGPRIAAAMALFGEKELIAQEGKGVAAVRTLPITALGLDEDVSTWLADMGLRACGDLQKLPRRALASRLGDRAQDVMEFLDGRDHVPLEVWRPPEIPEERIELDWGARSVESLAFVLKILCDRLAARLLGRGLAAGRLELVLALDRALCNPSPPEGSSHRLTLSVVLPSPIARAPDLLAVVRARLETCALAAPVLAATLRAPELARTPSHTLDWLTPQPKAERALPCLVAELSAELGEGAVGLLELVDTWLPADRTRLVPYGSRSCKTTYSLVTASLEPSRLVGATQISRGALVGAKHLARVDTVQWWRHAPTSQGRSRHDLFMAWVDGAPAWLELCEPSQPPRLRGWMD